MKTDIEIAQACEMKHIRDIAALCIMDEPFDIHKGMLEFEDDEMEWVRRGRGIVNSKLLNCK